MCSRCSKYYDSADTSKYIVAVNGMSALGQKIFMLQFLKEARRAVQVRAVKGVVENQKSASSGSYARNRGNILITVLLAMAAPAAWWPWELRGSAVTATHH
jgi:hypothetical protein